MNIVKGNIFVWGLIVISAAMIFEYANLHVVQLSVEGLLRANELAPYLAAWTLLPLLLVFKVAKAQPAIHLAYTSFVLLPGSIFWWLVLDSVTLVGVNVSLLTLSLLYIVIEKLLLLRLAAASREP